MPYVKDHLEAEVKGGRCFHPPSTPRGEAVSFYLEVSIPPEESFGLPRVALLWEGWVSQDLNPHTLELMMTATDPRDDLKADRDTAALLTLLVQALVDRPDVVDIHPIASEQLTIFEVRVAPEDVRRIIGRKGRTADAIRELLSKLGGKVGRRYHLEILEPTGRVTLPLGC